MSVYKKRYWQDEHDHWKPLFEWDVKPEPTRYVTRSISLGVLYIKWSQCLNPKEIDKFDSLKRPPKSQRTENSEYMRKALKKRDHTGVRWCIPCGHISADPGPVNLPKRYWFSLRAFKKPQYAGDCKYLYLNLPYRFRKYFGVEVVYKRDAPWDKPGFVSNY